VICPVCKGAWLQQTGNPYVFKCLDCKGEFRLVGKNADVLTVDMRKVNKLAKEINDFIAERKGDMIMAEVILALMGVPVIQSQLQEKGREEK
jgi:transcription initiation factor IIE alpha subunit